jgi:hypothetical protein
VVLDGLGNALGHLCVDHGDHLPSAFTPRPFMVRAVALLGIRMAPATGLSADFGSGAEMPGADLVDGRDLPKNGLDLPFR